MSIELPKGLISEPDGAIRCWWHGGHEDYLTYHDHEWGHPTADDRTLFEKICLEGFQSGLSWLTILRKRDNFRAAFENFEYDAIAEFTEEHVERLLQDKGIVRHRKKIESVINNARKARELVSEYGTLSTYFWQYEPLEADRPNSFDYDTLMTMSQTPESKAMSKDLKKRGWSFVGPTTAYAFMQAMGMVNDHLEGCICREKVEELRQGFDRPD